MDSSKEKVGNYTQISTEPEVYHRSTGDLEVVTPDNSNSRFYPRPDADGQHFSSSQHNNTTDRRRVCGVTPLVFWILILTIVLLLAAGLGAGLGAGLSKKDSNSKAAASTTPTATLPKVDNHPQSSSHPTAAAAAAHTTSTAPPSRDDVSCPANDTLVYTPSSHNTSSSTAYFLNSTTLTYTIHCNKTYFQSSDITDVQYIPGSNLSSCIQACSVYNVQVPDGGGQYGFYNLCSGVTVTPAGVCQLKQGVENDAAGVNRTGGSAGQSAKLLWFNDD